jgi:hypothetical protein
MQERRGRTRRRFLMEGSGRFRRACQSGGRSGRDFVMPRARKNGVAAQKRSGGDVRELFLPLRRLFLPNNPPITHSQHNGVPHAPTVRGDSCTEADTHHIDRLPRLPPRSHQEGTNTLQLQHQVCLITSNFPQRLPKLVPSRIPATCRIP